MATLPGKKYKKTQKFAGEEVPDLVARARSEPTSGEYKFIDNLEPDEALNELIERFIKLTNNLVGICISGKVCTFRRYEVAFIKKWSSSKDVHGTAVMLKRELGDIYPHEELYNIGNIAIVEAVKRTKTNLSTTIITTLKDLLFSLTKNQNGNLTSSYDEKYEESGDFKHLEQDGDFRIQMQLLSLEEQNEIEDFMLNDTPLSLELKLKLRSIYE